MTDSADPVPDSTSTDVPDGLARPAWLDGAGPTGQGLPEGFDDPDWYVDQEAARSGAARLNPEWLDLTVFSQVSKEVNSVPPQTSQYSSDAAVDAETEVNTPGRLDADASQEPLVESWAHVADTASGDDTAALREQGSDLEGGRVKSDRLSGSAAGTSGVGDPAAIENESGSIYAHSPDSESDEHGPLEVASGESDAVAVPADTAAANEGDSTETTGTTTDVSELGSDESEDPYRPRFSVAPKSVQASAVVQFVLAAVNAAAAALVVAVLVSSSSAVELPFVGVGFPRPFLIALALICTAGAVCAVLSAIGVSRGEVKWWKAGFVAPVTTAWCFPLSLVAVACLLRPDTRDWVI